MKMKKLILILAIIFNGFVFGQEITIDKTIIRDTIPICYEVPQPIVYMKVEEKAKFSGGINVFKKLIEEKFDKSVLENERTAYAKIRFIVDVDGSIYKVEITGKNQNFNVELGRAVKSIKEKWSPAKINKKVVKSYYEIFFNMNLK